MTAQLEDHVRGAIAQDSRDADVPAERIGVKVSAGWVTLTGTVDYEFQSDAAFDDVAMIKGIGGITNKIRVVTS